MPNDVRRCLTTGDNEAGLPVLLVIGQAARTHWRASRMIVCAYLVMRWSVSWSVMMTARVVSMAAAALGHAGRAGSRNGGRWSVGISRKVPTLLGTPRADRCSQNDRGARSVNRASGA